MGSIPDGIVGIFHDIVLPVALWPRGYSASNRNEYREFPGVQRRPVRRADLTTYMCRLFSNRGASTSWNPQGLSSPVMGLLLPFCLRTSVYCISVVGIEFGYLVPF